MDGTLILLSSWTHADVRDGGFAELSAPLVLLYA